MVYPHFKPPRSTPIPKNSGDQGITPFGILQSKQSKQSLQSLKNLQKEDDHPFPGPDEFEFRFLYGEGFYIAENIFGYTGNLGDHPTVYFLLDLGGGEKRVGHITQKYPTNPDNVGRGTVYNCTYEYGHIKYTGTNTRSEKNINTGPKVAGEVFYEKLTNFRWNWEMAWLEEQNERVSKLGIPHTSRSDLIDVDVSNRDELAKAIERNPNRKIFPW